MRPERDGRAGGWQSIWCGVVRPWIQLPGLANVWLWVSGEASEKGRLSLLES